MNICRNGGLGSKKSSSSSGMKIHQLRAVIKVHIVTFSSVWRCFFCALCSLSLKEPWGLELRDTCSAWLLSYGCWCQSLSLSHPGILSVLGLVGIFAFLSLLHLQAPARYLIPLPMHLKHQRCCWWTHLSSSLVTGFLIWVIIRLYHDTYAVNSFYGYHFVLIKGMTLCPPYLLGFVFGVWPHKKSQL